MTDPRHPTDSRLKLFDSAQATPPSGRLMLINPGGVLILGAWSPRCLAWGRVPTRADLIDPAEERPPQMGEHLVLMSPGGVVVVGPWFAGCLAWSRKPRIPATVKARLAG